MSEEIVNQMNMYPEDINNGTSECTNECTRPGGLCARHRNSNQFYCEDCEVEIVLQPKDDFQEFLSKLGTPKKAGTPLQINTYEYEGCTVLPLDGYSICAPDLHKHLRPNCLFRLEIGLAVDGWIDYFLYMYKITKSTAQGHWIQVSYISNGNSKQKFVATVRRPPGTPKDIEPSIVRKRFAYPTVYEALIALQKRKQKQLEILSMRAKELVNTVEQINITITRYTTQEALTVIND